MRCSSAKIEDYVLMVVVLCESLQFCCAAKDFQGCYYSVAVRFLIFDGLVQPRLKQYFAPLYAYLSELGRNFDKAFSRGDLHRCHGGVDIRAMHGLGEIQARSTRP